MQHTHTLTRHKDIQEWVVDRHGLPAVSRVANRFGEVKPRLTIHFGKMPTPVRSPTIDDGVSPARGPRGSRSSIASSWLSR